MLADRINKRQYNRMLVKQDEFHKKYDLSVNYPNASKRVSELDDKIKNLRKSFLGAGCQFPRPLN